MIDEIYKSPGISRGGMWEKLNRPHAREDSAEADIFKMLIRDLTLGSVIRQHRTTDYAGNFLNKQPARRRAAGQAPRTAKSAFDEMEPYELTDLGRQFVHYAMNEITAKIEYKEFEDEAS